MSRADRRRDAERAAVVDEVPTLVLFRAAECVVAQELRTLVRPGLARAGAGGDLGDLGRQSLAEAVVGVLRAEERGRGRGRVLVVEIAGPAEGVDAGVSDLGAELVILHDLGRAQCGLGAQAATRVRELGNRGRADVGRDLGQSRQNVIGQ